MDDAVQAFTVAYYPLLQLVLHYFWYPRGVCFFLFRLTCVKVVGGGGRFSRVAGVGRLVGGDREDAPGGRVPHGLRALAHDHLLVHLPWRVHREDGHGERSRSQLLSR